MSHSAGFSDEGVSIMRKRSFHAAVTAAVFCVSAFLLACPLGQLRLLIPDFFTKEVKGVQLYRIDDASGQLVGAGHIEFLGLELNKQGNELLKYTQFTPEDTPWFGPIFTEVVRDPSQPASLEVTLAFLNQLPAGWFKVASYNLYGTSTASASQTFISGQEG
jgi:hypothetical protein